MFEKLLKQLVQQEVAVLFAEQLIDQSGKEESDALSDYFSTNFQIQSEEQSPVTSSDDIVSRAKSVTQPLVSSQSVE